MKAISKFSLKKVDEIYANLFYENRKIKKVVGQLIEEAFEINNNYLLFVTEGLPYEEGLHIYYFSNQFELLDWAELSAPYTAGILNDLKVKDNTITFTFFHHKEFWQLDVLQNPKRVFSVSLASVLKRPFSIGKYRYFNIREV